MEFVIGILLILTFFALAYYCVRGYNLMIGFLIISVLWTVLSLAGAGISSPEFLPHSSLRIILCFSLAGTEARDWWQS